MRVRRLRKTPAHLEITAFINLIVVLVPFLLSVAVFTRLAVIDLSLPAPSSARIEQLDPNKPLKLEVIVRADKVEVNDKVGGALMDPIANVRGEPDTKTLGQAIALIKQKYPQHDDATVLAESNTSYEALVRVMDAVRAGRQVQNGKPVAVDYFPAISIGDAPVVRSQVALAAGTQGSKR